MNTQASNPKNASNAVNQTITGRAAALAIANLDTDQIIPKQFLRGIDKAGLAPGLFYDLRFDGVGQVRPDFVLNQSAFAGVDVLIAGPNFGCGSSREHAVWGMQQFGFKAVIASSYGEIFYSNAMNNSLMLVMLPEEQVQALMAQAHSAAAPLAVEIDVQKLQVRCGDLVLPFTLSERHRRMFLDGLDVIGASLTYRAQIGAFAEQHWAAQPWVRDVARITRERLSIA